MSQPVIPVPAPTLLPVRGGGQFPVRRIYCVGRNFAEHAKEMGASVDRGNPVFFMKPGDAIVAGGGEVPYPPGTQDLHHEVELVVALGRDADGGVPVEQASSLVFGYGVGLDLTRRDLQARAKAGGLPWDTAKGFDHSAPCSEIVPVAAAGALAGRRLWLEVNGQPRQGAPLGDMVFSVEEVISALSGLYALKAGDLVYMGTPSGVAALQRGDSFHAGIEGLVELRGSIA
ncbi:MULTISPECIES: fumarylacetoacetate hydrolase family protein [unclassified Arenimonas]|uniref:fumarylacetoacetate hydrolase family protein n=1 Tax=unclassified Arenimonas TaxID=2641713 RepID=UPI00086A80F1|nr:MULTISPECIES: fumarylacetoacetate hydrolase family protein [unclassified Arenimonas]ODS64535.1 MAG: fumarylacetoacetate hydrolase [Arenimonas sp. SCN 70-307]